VKPVWMGVKSKQVHNFLVHLFIYLILIFYSYANVSLTVSLEALLAGSALASEPNTTVKINQAKIPLVPKTTGMGAVRIATPTP
jgi:hypothetical protein